MFARTLAEKVRKQEQENGGKFERKRKNEE
jgi:hypothetical protein